MWGVLAIVLRELLDRRRPGNHFAKIVPVELLLAFLVDGPILAEHRTVVLRVGTFRLVLVVVGGSFSPVDAAVLVLVERLDQGPVLDQRFTQERVHIHGSTGIFVERVVILVGDFLRNVTGRLARPHRAEVQRVWLDLVDDHVPAHLRFSLVTEDSIVTALWRRLFCGRLEVFQGSRLMLRQSALHSLVHPLVRTFLIGSGVAYTDLDYRLVLVLVFITATGHRQTRACTREPLGLSLRSFTPRTGQGSSPRTQLTLALGLPSRPSERALLLRRTSRRLRSAGERAHQVFEHYSFSLLCTILGLRLGGRGGVDWFR